MPCWFTSPIPQRTSANQTTESYNDRATTRLPAISLAVAVGWWSVARWPAAARWAGIALLAAAGLAALWGVTQEGINRWSLLIFGGGGALLLAWSLALPRLVGAAWRWTTRMVYALPFAAMAGLSLLALRVFILPQLR